MPFASVTVPSLGRVPAAMARLPAAVRLSDGAAMPIGVAGAFCATVRVGEEAVGAVVSISSVPDGTVAPARLVEIGLPAASVTVAPLAFTDDTASLAEFCPAATV